MFPKSFFTQSYFALGYFGPMDEDVTRHHSYVYGGTMWPYGE